MTELVGATMRTALCSLLALLPLAGCSMHVSADKMPGHYSVSFPFGVSTLTLRPDGTFVQTATFNSEPPAMVTGAWTFDPAHSRVDLRGAMDLVDGFGHLNKNWRATTDFLAIPVERLWLKVEIEWSESHPYVKQ